MLGLFAKRALALAGTGLCLGVAQGAVTAVFQGNTLSVSSDADDSITLTTDATNVKINGSNPDNLNDPGMPVAVSDIAGINLTAGPLGSTLDASGFPGAATPQQFLRIDFQGGDGADTIIGSPLTDQVIAGPGDDSISTGAGLDDMIWEVGDGTDTVDLGDENDRARFDAPVGGTVPLNAVFEDNGSGVLQFRQTDGAMTTMLLQGAEELVFIGRGGDDSLTVTDLSATPATRIEFRGEGGTNNLDASGSSTPVSVNHEFSEGNDTLKAGSSGNDSLAVFPNSFDVADTYTVSQSGASLLVNGSGTGTFTIDAAGFEFVFLNPGTGNDTITIQELTTVGVTNLNVQAGEGDDMVSIAPSTVAEMNLDGFTETTADTLVYDTLSLPLQTNGDTFTTQGRQPVVQNGFENVQILNPAPREGDQWEL